MDFAFYISLCVILLLPGIDLQGKSCVHFYSQTIKKVNSVYVTCNCTVM